VGRLASAFCRTVLLALAHASEVAAAVQPFVIAQPTVVTAPMDVGYVIVVDGGSLIVAGVAEPGFRLSGKLLVVGHGAVRLADSASCR
jgi:hypothetical protein